MASGDVGEISLRDNCLQARHFGTNLQTAAAGGSGTGIPAGCFLAGAVDTLDVNNGMVKYVDVTLTSAQIKALNATPIALLAAPVTGLVNIVHAVVAKLVYVSATYACNASGASLFYGDNTTAVGITLTQAFIQSASGTNYLHVRGAATALAPVSASAINIKAASTDPTTGDSLIKIRVYYSILPSTF